MWFNKLHAWQAITTGDVGLVLWLINENSNANTKKTEIETKIDLKKKNTYTQKKIDDIEM